jgi:hypothetical protein
MLKKIKIKLIFTQIAAILFLVSGIKRLYIATQADIYEAIINENFDKLNSITNLTIGEFFMRPIWWTLGTFITGILIIGLINWRYKVSILNSIITFIIGFSFFPLGIFNDGIISQLLNSLCYLFSEMMGIAFFIGGTIISFIALALLWKSINLNKENHVQQHI